MRTHEERHFRIPIDELRSIIKKQHGVELAGVEPFIDREYVVFSVQMPGEGERAGLPPMPRGTPPELPEIRTTRRARRRKRNRIKTRGWKVIERFTNAQGLPAKVYEPFVSALKSAKLTRAEQRTMVREVMVRNGNSPNEASVDYYLDNTLEYLSRNTNKEGQSK